MTGFDVRDDLLDEADGLLREVRLRYDRDRVALWRWRAVLQLRRASALALSALALEGLRLSKLVDWMWPDQDWPHMPFAHPRPLPLEPLLRDDRKGFRLGGSIRDRVFERHFGVEGCVVRPPSHASGRFGVSVAGGELALCVDLGSCRLAVCGDRAKMRLPPGVPDSLLAACVGRPLTDVVDHPLFAGADHVIGSVSHVGRLSVGVLSFRDEVVALPPAAVGIHVDPSGCAPSKAVVDIASAIEPF